MCKTKSNQPTNNTQHCVSVTSMLCMLQKLHTPKPGLCTSLQLQGRHTLLVSPKTGHTQPAGYKQTTRGRTTRATETVRQAEYMTVRVPKGPQNKRNRERQASRVHDSESAWHCKPAGVGVHAAGWLIQEDNCRATQKGNSYTQLAPLPTRQIASRRVQLAIQPYTNNHHDISHYMF